MVRPFYTVRARAASAGGSVRPATRLRGYGDNPAVARVQSRSFRFQLVYHCAQDAIVADDRPKPVLQPGSHRPRWPSRRSPAVLLHAAPHFIGIHTRLAQRLLNALLMKQTSDQAAEAVI